MHDFFQTKGVQSTERSVCVARQTAPQTAEATAVLNRSEAHLAAKQPGEKCGVLVTHLVGDAAA
jgi:hypothetical protein